MLLLVVLAAACGGAEQPAGWQAPASSPAEGADGGGTDGAVDAGATLGADAGGSDAGAADAGSSAQADAGACLASPVLAQLGKNKLLVGADMSDAVAESAAFDVRYLYLAGGLADGNGTCSTCGGGCTAQGQSCANSAGGCGWWGCWQDDTVAPGQYVRSLLAKTDKAGQLPMITYYEVLQTTGVAEGAAEVRALQDSALTTRYFNDWRFVLQQLGTRKALLHLEPDLWGYAQQSGSNPHAMAAAVKSGNPADCAAEEDSVAGFGRCLIAMVRKYAPNARVGLHASSWAGGPDATGNRDASLDVAAEARKVADFLTECGAGQADFVVIEASDRDAGYYRSQGKNTFWDATNATLPSFHQAFAWATALTQRLGKPALWWQLPLGNMSLPNVVGQWQDNRVEYFFAHPQEVARTNAFAMVFGAGQSQQTTPSTDNGNFVTSVRSLVAAGGQPACP